MKKVKLMIEIGGLYKDKHGLLIAYKYDAPQFSEFRMKIDYVFCIIEDNIIHKKNIYIKILMTNTGKLQLIIQRAFIGCLEKGFIEKIG